MTKREDEQREWFGALRTVLEEGREGLSLQDAADFILSTERVARRLHQLYAQSCNEGLSTSSQAKVATLEATLKQAFATVGLGLYLNGDPRGNPVGILTPKTGRYNTMGGAECGWRL